VTSKDRLPGRRRVDVVHQLATAQVGPRHSHPDLIDRSARSERRLGSRGHRACYVAVCLRSSKIAVVVVVRNIVDVGDVRIRNVDVTQVTSTHPTSAVVPAVPAPAAIARIVGRPPAQWEPAEVDAKAPTHPTESKTDTKPGSADPPDQRRSIVRVPVAEGAGSPAPTSVPRDPAAVVERSESPGSAIHPRPSPGSNPHPAAIAVRRPARRHGSRDPDRPVGGDDL